MECLYLLQNHRHLPHASWITYLRDATFFYTTKLVTLFLKHHTSLLSLLMKFDQSCFSLWDLFCFHCFHSFSVASTLPFFPAITLSPPMFIPIAFNIVLLMFRPLPPLLLFDMLPTHYFLCYLQQASPDSWKSHILEQLLSFFSITTPHGLVATGVLCFRQVSVDG